MATATLICSIEMIQRMCMIRTIFVFNVLRHRWNYSSCQTIKIDVINRFLIRSEYDDR